MSEHVNVAAIFYVELSVFIGYSAALPSVLLGYRCNSNPCGIALKSIIIFINKRWHRTMCDIGPYMYVTINESF